MRYNSLSLFLVRENDMIALCIHARNKTVFLSSSSLSEAIACQNANEIVIFSKREDFTPLILPSWNPTLIQVFFVSLWNCVRHCLRGLERGNETLDLSNITATMIVPPLFSNVLFLFFYEIIRWMSHSSKEESILALIFPNSGQDTVPPGFFPTVWDTKKDFHSWGP